jgi:hypothetical protein
MWSALSDERTGLSFTTAAGPCQRSLSRVRVPWDLRPYFTVSDLRLHFLSPPTTRRATVEVFNPASTWGSDPTAHSSRYIAAARTAYKTPSILVLQRNCLATSYYDVFPIVACIRCCENVYGVVA